ncbi:3-hydroxyacyl-CoA dehydrogenase family protein [Chitinophagaceae bacterium 26-R-25]|nr:3-hydroxyacyl-CoA dehydrogenase family protein [Chitinophagaceae bacterium 26-R-25]
MKNIDTTKINVGVVGLGLMGTSLIVSLLMAGHRVIAIAPINDDMTDAPQRILEHLMICENAGSLNQPIDAYLSQLVISQDYLLLAPCDIVLECVIEIPEIKRSVYKKVEAIISSDAILASNTSAIPISDLQKGLVVPQRFLGIHWAEPSYFTRFMEITCGIQTDAVHAEWVYELAHCWGKEPTLLRKDIRGFVTNRLMYAVYREGLSLVEKGTASFDDVDKAFRYDVGSWITLMGIFRRMDYLGLKDAFESYNRLAPHFCNDEHIPALMQTMVDKNAKGTRNCTGLYSYTPDEAKQWDDAFAAFNVDIYRLAAMYPSQREKKRAIVAANTFRK